MNSEGLLRSAGKDVESQQVQDKPGVDMWELMIYATACYHARYADISSVCVSLREMINEWRKTPSKQFLSPPAEIIPPKNEMKMGKKIPSRPSQGTDVCFKVAASLI